MFHFHHHNQHNGESIAEYIAELRRLYTEFSEYLNQALPNRMVCGLLSDSLQKRLLAEADLTLARALSFSQARYRRGRLCTTNAVPKGKRDPSDK